MLCMRRAWLFHVMSLPFFSPNSSPFPLPPSPFPSLPTTRITTTSTAVGRSTSRGPPLHAPPILRVPWTHARDWLGLLAIYVSRTTYSLMASLSPLPPSVLCIYPHIECSTPSSVACQSTDQL
ncbi:hypothetical protein BKA80DRAFT_280352, partial [Phyllosticta citrichinensis]